MDSRCVRWLFLGRVQGVGFRATVASAARGFPSVRGLVRNLPDGSVEVVASGPLVKLETFKTEIERALGRHIDQVIEQDTPADLSLPSSFEIRH